MAVVIIAIAVLQLHAAGENWQTVHAACDLAHHKMYLLHYGLKLIEAR
jgi:hypothetical protein